MGVYEGEPDLHILWIRSTFIAVPHLRIDGQFFYGCEIRDSVVEYAGGLTDFGTTNTTVNSTIVPGTPMISATEFLRVKSQFKWTDQPLKSPPSPSPESPR